MLNKMVYCIGILVLAAAPLAAQQAASIKPTFLNGVGIAQQMKQQVPPNLVFRDETGKSVRLGDYFGSKPIVLSLVYFNCPFLCTEVLNGEVRSFQGVPLTLGKDYYALSVSIDPKDGPAEAGVKTRMYEALYARPSSPGGWHFLTGDQASIQALSDAVGFHYAYDQPTGQFAHAATIMILTPQGRLARYFYGVQYPPRDMRLGLLEASEGKISSPTEAALLFCYHYDPLTGKYGLAIANVMKIAGGITVLVLGIFLGIMFRKERRYKVVPAGQSLRTNHEGGGSFMRGHHT